MMNKKHRSTQCKNKMAAPEESVANDAAKKTFVYDIAFFCPKSASSEEESLFFIPGRPLLSTKFGKREESKSIT